MKRLLIFIYFFLFYFTLHLGRSFWFFYYKNQLFYSDYEIGVLACVLIGVSAGIALTSHIFKSVRTVKELLFWASVIWLIYLTGILYFSSFFWHFLWSFWAGIALFYSLSGSINLLLKKMHYLDSPRGIGLILFGVFLSAGLAEFIVSILLYRKDLFTWLILLFSSGILLVGLARVLPPTQILRFQVLRVEYSHIKRWWLIIWGLLGWHYGAELVSLTLFLTKNLQLNWDQVAYFLAIDKLVVAGTILFFSCFLKLIFKIQTLYYGLLLMGLGLITMVISSDLGLLITGRVIHGIGEGVTLLILLSKGNKLLLPHLRGVGPHIFPNILVGISIGALVSSGISASFGYAWPLLIAGLAVILSVVFLTRICSRYTG